jgi:hypothetical protein
MALVANLQCCPFREIAGVKTTIVSSTEYVIEYVMEDAPVPPGLLPQAVQRSPYI